MVREILTSPVATVYVFRKAKRPVAVAIGDYPPDPYELDYDSVLRIPVVANGNRPKWRAFSWNQHETINAALARSRWPGQEVDDGE